MNLLGVTSHGQELATILAELLQRHRYIDAPPTDLDALLQAARLASREPPKPAFALIQEGGTSQELYIHSWPTAEDAEQDRIDCSNDGAYRTSPVIEIPGALALMGESFYEVVEKFVRGTKDLGFGKEPDTAPTGKKASKP